MGSHPLNLAVRFFLELAALLALALWGWRQGEGWLRFLLALAVPLIAAVLWGVFRVPNDPGPAPVAVPGLLRLALELTYFSFATWALSDIGATNLSWALGIVVAVHYIISYDRIRWLVRQ